MPADRATIRHAALAFAMVGCTAAPVDDGDTSVLVVETPHRYLGGACGEGTYAAISPSAIPPGFRRSPLDMAAPAVGTFGATLGVLWPDIEWVPLTVELIPKAWRAYVPEDLHALDRGVVVDLDVAFDAPPYFVDEVLPGELCLGPTGIAGLRIGPYPHDALEGTGREAFPGTHLTMDGSWAHESWGGRLEGYDEASGITLHIGDWF